MLAFTCANRRTREIVRLAVFKLWNFYKPLNAVCALGVIVHSWRKAKVAFTVDDVHVGGQVCGLVHQRTSASLNHNFKEILVAVLLSWYETGRLH